MTAFSVKIVVMSGKFHKGFKSLTTENLLDSLPVEGRVPSWLRGSLFRNGPALFEVGTRNFRHWFDGFGMTHKFSFEDDGRVSYKNRFSHGPGYNSARETGTMRRNEFATPARLSTLSRISALLKGASRSRNANENVLNIGGDLVVTGFTPETHEINPLTLMTVNASRDGSPAVGHLGGGHFIHDYDEKTTYAVSTKLGPISHHLVHKIPFGSKKRIPVAQHRSIQPRFMHSFAITKRRVILTEHPWCVNPITFLAGTKPLLECCSWRPEKGTRFTLIDKRDGTVVGVFETEPFFTLHHVTAVDSSENEVVVDLCAYSDVSIIDKLKLSNLRAADDPALPHCEPRRYRLNLNDGSVRRDALCEASLEFPRVHDVWRDATNYRHLYGVGVRAGTRDFHNQLLKVNVQAGTFQQWFEEDCHPGEPVFAPKPAANDEDAGALLSVVFDGATGTSFLLILDAKTLAELARIPLPHHVPFGFHGQWYADSPDASAT